MGTRLVAEFLLTRRWWTKLHKKPVMWCGKWPLAISTNYGILYIIYGIFLPLQSFTISSFLDFVHQPYLFFLMLSVRFSCGSTWFESANKNTHPLPTPAGFCVLPECLLQHRLRHQLQDVIIYGPITPLSFWEVFFAEITTLTWLYSLIFSHF